MAATTAALPHRHPIERGQPKLHKKRQQQRRNQSSGGAPRRGIFFESYVSVLVVACATLYCVAVYVLFYKRYGDGSGHWAWKGERAGAAATVHGVARLRQRNKLTLEKEAAVVDLVSPLVRGQHGEVVHSETAKKRRPSAATQPVISSTSKAVPVSPVVSSGRRFPLYGTPPFADKCGWTLGFGGGGPPSLHSTYDDSKPADCTLYYRPHPNWNEGLAAWSGEIVAAYLRAHQLGCRLLFDYGNGTDITTALMPHESDLGTPYDWRVPANFECRKENHCFVVYSPTIERMDVIASEAGGLPLPGLNNTYAPKVPCYRNSATGTLTEDDFPTLAEDISPPSRGGFNFTIGMACSMGRLLTLSPKAGEVVPNLHTQLLPALHDPGTLVIGLYLRTGRTDDMVVLEHGDNLDTRRKLPTRRIKGEGELKSMQQKQIKCAVQLEAQRLREAAARGEPYKRAVWMLVTDSPWVRGEVVRTKNWTTTVGINMRREVLTTSTRGVHTRKKRDPSTLDFAEAAVDWYLMGETDLVVGGGMYSFGKTAALRTHRPYYEGFRGCVERTLVW